MRRWLSLLAVGLFSLMLSGCFTVEQVVDLTEADGARLSAVLELQGEVGEAEIDLFISALHRAVPMRADVPVRASERRFNRHISMDGQGKAAPRRFTLHLEGTA